MIWSINFASYPPGGNQQQQQQQNYSYVSFIHQNKFQAS